MAAEAGADSVAAEAGPSSVDSVAAKEAGTENVEAAAEAGTDSVEAAAEARTDDVEAATAAEAGTDNVEAAEEEDDVRPEDAPEPGLDREDPDESPTVMEESPTVFEEEAESEDSVVEVAAKRSPGAKSNTKGKKGAKDKGKQAKGSKGSKGSKDGGKAWKGKGNVRRKHAAMGSGRGEDPEEPAPARVKAPPKAPPKAMPKMTGRGILVLPPKRNKPS